MKRSIYCLMLLAVLVLAGCAIQETLVVLEPNGQILRGATTADFTGGHFSVTGDRMSCSGVYNPADNTPTVSIPAVCTDGRNGVATVTRAPGGLSGAGTFQLSDGEVARVAFGPAASTLLAAARTPRRAEGSRSALQTWASCSLAQAQHIDNGKSAPSAIAATLAASCSQEWSNARQDACSQVAWEAAVKCRENFDASLASFEMNVVHAERARKAGGGR